MMKETLGHCSAFVREMIALELVVHTYALDAIWNSCEASGAVQELGPDAVQRMLADGFPTKEHEPKDLAQASANGVAIREAADRVGRIRSRSNENRRGATRAFTAATLQRQQFSPVR